MQVLYTQTAVNKYSKRVREGHKQEGSEFLKMTGSKMSLRSPERRTLARYMNGQKVVKASFEWKCAKFGFNNTQEKYPG